MQGSNPRHSEGRRQLTELLRGKLNRGDVARSCQVSRKAVGFWYSGACKPAYHARRELWERYGIPMDAWDRPPDVALPTHAKAA